MDFRLSLDDFDKALLPVDKSLLEADADLLRKSIQRFFVDRLGRLGGQARIVIDESNKTILISWSPVESKGLGAVKDYALSLLSSGRIDEAVPFLEMILSRDPADEMGLYNLGMVYSDKGQLDRALRCLKDLVEIAPLFANGWVALGVAMSRSGDSEGSRLAFENAVRLEPKNGSACRNWAAVLLKSGDYAGAKKYFEDARALLPGDPATLLGLGQCLFEMGEASEADPLLIEVVRLAPTSDIGETARELRSQIAARHFRATSVPRMDAVMYCLAAMEKFEGRPKAEIGQVVFEIVMLGRRGLDVNDPSPKYTLKSMVGQFSGLQLVAYMYVGFRAIAPDTDPGFDLSKEYALAIKMHGGQAP